jgi:hypothetical protein|tara:strand:+ start:388 stop:627 length:240 start_codon:yes stop_codon:yes gene_type:complete
MDDVLLNRYLGRIEDDEALQEEATEYLLKATWDGLYQFSRGPVTNKIEELGDELVNQIAEAIRDGKVSLDEATGTTRFE